MTALKRSDNFMRDEIHPTRARGLTYWDGVRFGFGFLIANLLGLSIIGGLVYLLVHLAHLG